MPKLLFPRTRDFKKLFKRVEPSKAEMLRVALTTGGSISIDPKMRIERLKGGSYFTPVFPDIKLVQALNGLVVSDEYMTWKAIEWKGGTTLLLIEYNKIIGSRWIALIHTNTLPRRPPCPKPASVSASRTKRKAPPRSPRSGRRTSASSTISCGSGRRTTSSRS
jgi:hypothetical protein